MTFTLLGRWQIRILLLATVGLVLTLAIALKSGGAIAGQALLTLIYLCVFGLGWDAVYHQLQRWRWDGDWNGLLQLAGAVWEGVFVVILIKLGLPGIDRSNFNLGGWLGFYALSCVLNFVTMHSLLKILSPYSRFNGGQWF